jgi:hypothetical protein
MLELISGYWISQMVYAVTRLGVPEALSGKSLAPGEIAARVGANEAFLRRVLRALASVGVFAENTRGRFSLTPLGRTLRAGQPGSLRDFALMMVDDHNWRAWGALLETLKTGQTAFDACYGMGHFDYLALHPEKSREFSASMASISGTENEAVARGYPYGRHTTLVDVGGAHGHLLAAILRRHKKLRGILYDRPEVVEGAEASGFVTSPGVRDRVRVAGGSFFESVPRGADAYLMKYILHDWDDARCATILGHCREALAAGGRVLAVDRVIRAGNGPDWSKWLDINMMVVPGGLERTADEFRALFAQAGLRLLKIHKTATPLSILEAARD